MGFCRSSLPCLPRVNSGRPSIKGQEPAEAVCLLSLWLSWRKRPAQERSADLCASDGWPTIRREAEGNKRSGRPAPAWAYVTLWNPHAWSAPAPKEEQLVSTSVLWIPDAVRPGSFIWWLDTYTRRRSM